MNQFEDRFAKWVIRHRWGIILGAVLFLAGTASGIPLLTFNQDLRVFFSEDNPQLKTLEQHENTYIKFDNVFYVLAPKVPEIPAATEV